jgi:hypothetical protein
LLSDRRPLSSDRQQLPVPGHNNWIDDMDNPIRRSDIGLLEVNHLKKEGDAADRL